MFRSSHSAFKSSKLTYFTVLDQSSQVWWRWMNVFLTLVIWSVELVVTGEDDSDPIGKEWKVE